MLLVGICKLCQSANLIVQTPVLLLISLYRPIKKKSEIGAKKWTRVCIKMKNGGR